MYRVTLINDDVVTTIHTPFLNGEKLLEGSIKQEVNAIDNFTFSLLPDNSGYDKIRPLKSLVKVYNTKTNHYDFEGRILMPTQTMSESGDFGKSFVCEGELAYLNDSAQRHGEYHDITVKKFLEIIIDNHNRDIKGDEIDKVFRVGKVEVDSSSGTLYRYLGYESTLDTIKDKLIDRLGGELVIRKVNGVRYLDYVKSSGQAKNTEIRLAQNLKSLTQEVDPTDIITRLVPLGERIESEDETATDASEARLTIESVNNKKDYIDDLEAMKVFGIITKSETWDDITNPSILKTRGQQFLKENNRVKVKYQVTALDLSLIDLDIDSFDLYNSYPVINEVMGINEHLRVVGKTINVVNPMESSLDFGDKFLTASQYQTKNNRRIKVIKELESTVTNQRHRMNQLSKATNQAQKEIESLRDIINNMDVESIDETLDEVMKQMIEISNSINDIGFEITSLELSIKDLESFKDNQDLINLGQQDVVSDILKRLEVIEESLN